MLDVCTECSSLSLTEFQRAPTVQSEEDVTPESVPDASAAVTAVLTAVGRTWEQALCIALGLTFLLVRFYYLILAPSQGKLETVSIVNIHRLVLGQTAAILGGIFLAVGIRPR